MNFTACFNANDHIQVSTMIFIVCFFDFYNRSLQRNLCFQINQQFALRARLCHLRVHLTLSPTTAQQQ